MVLMDLLINWMGFIDGNNGGSTNLSIVSAVSKVSKHVALN